MALARINDHKYFFDCDTLTVRKVSNGRWEVTFTNNDTPVTFTVIGGRQSGGASNEWFCHRPDMYGDQWLPTKSMVAAIRLGVCY